MHAATSDFLSFRPIVPVQTANENDADARLITEVLAKLWDLIAVSDAEPPLRPGA